MQHHAQDAVDAEPEVPEAGGVHINRKLSDREDTRRLHAMPGLAASYSTSTRLSAINSATGAAQASWAGWTASS